MNRLLLSLPYGILLLVWLGLRAHAASLPFVGCPDLPVRSLDRSVAWYTSVLEFRLQNTGDSAATGRLFPEVSASTSTRTARLNLGDECIDLTEYKPSGRQFPRDSRANDVWFQHIALVVSDMNAAYRRLRTAGVRSVSNMPQTLPRSNKEAAGIAAFYFRDPDGHYLELIHFPPGKGQVRWQQTSVKLFLGIDHTAMVVSDTARSFAFYRDQLGLHVEETSENVGTEQEHLSGVFEADVQITSLRGASGIGIELLCYITPGDGHAIPPDWLPSDIASWTIPIEIGRERAAALKSEPLPVWKALPSTSQAKLEGAWVKDPDAHRLELIRR